MTDPTPLRVAIIGSGPAAFYAAEFVLKQRPGARVDMIERLPTPYGLVRGGVAPDHQKIKSVIRIYEQVAKQPGFRFFGNVEFGADVTLDDLRSHFHQIVFATGAQTDRRIGIPGEDLAGVHSATEFVAWYNGHPDYRDHAFDLSGEHVAIVGVGNVAVDVARILLLTPDELATTDMADHAVEALRQSQVRVVSMLGRRGPAQAAFTNLEVKELGERLDADIVVAKRDLELDPLSREQVTRGGRIAQDKIDILTAYAGRAPAGRHKRLEIRFFVSPVECLGDANGRVRALRLVHNELVAGAGGELVCQALDRVEELPAELVFRSVGYRGVALPGVPFDARSCLIPNDKGRVLTTDTRERVPGLYVTGWIKRGPTGVIGTNKADSIETAKSMLEDADAGAIPAPSHPEPERFDELLAKRQPCFVSFDDWQRLDRLEAERGASQSRPRVKFTSAEDMLAAIGKTVSGSKG